MSFFIFPRNEGELLDVQFVQSAIAALQRVESFHLREDDFFEAEWLFTFQGGQLHCALMKNGRAVKIEEEEPAACEFAIMVRDLVETSVAMTDDRYSFHLELDDFGSSADLWNAIDRLTTAT